MSLVSFSSYKRDTRFSKSIAIDCDCKKEWYQKYHGDSEHCGARILWIELIFIVLYKIPMANEVLKRDMTERKDVT